MITEADGRLKVGQLMWPMVLRLKSSDSIMHAGERMREIKVGSALVFEDGTLTGIITERDLMRAFVDGVDKELSNVRDYMTSSPVTIDVDTDVAEAASLMIKIAARHLPVVDGEEVVGLLSARDLLSVLATRVRAGHRLTRSHGSGRRLTLQAGKDLGS